MPPPAVQLKRIALALGLPDTKAVHTYRQTEKPPEEVFRQAIAAGLPVMEGRPDDPMLELLDL